MTGEPRTIYKYALLITDSQKVLLPKNARILHVGVQREEVHLWALVQPDNPLTERTISVRGTGHDCSTVNDTCVFLGTVMLRGGALVFHVFEKVGE